MLDVLEVAREKGMEEGIKVGKALGIQEGKTLRALEISQKYLLIAISEKFGFLPPSIAAQVRKIRNQDTLHDLHCQVFRRADMADFEKVMRQMVAGEGD